MAHGTSTVPGVAASPWQPQGLRRLARFKQRPGPFLVLADSISTAAHLAVALSSDLRQLMHSSWPGRTTLVFRARPGLPSCCYQHGAMAVRVDASPFVRDLAGLCGGLILSSSLNRRGAVTPPLTRKLRWRWQRHLAVLVPGEGGSGTPSAMLRIRGRRTRQLR